MDLRIYVFDKCLHIDDVKVQKDKFSQMNIQRHKIFKTFVVPLHVKTRYYSTLSSVILGHSAEGSSFEPFNGMCFIYQRQQPNVQ